MQTPKDSAVFLEAGALRFYNLKNIIKHLTFSLLQEGGCVKVKRHVCTALGNDCLKNMRFSRRNRVLPVYLYKKKLWFVSYAFIAA